MVVLKFVGGAIATIILVKLALWVLSVVFGIVAFAIGLVKLAVVVGVITLICYGVYRLVARQEKTAA